MNFNRNFEVLLVDIHEVDLTTSRVNLQNFDK